MTDIRSCTVLLRVLEYYQGIMILTTNRIKSLDVAVQSRIHLAVRYDDLATPQMCNILKTILNKFNVKEIDKEDIMSWFNIQMDANEKFKLNGRQIRNLVLSAQSIALSHDRDTITQPDFKKTFIATKNFHTQLSHHVDHQRLLREAPSELTS